MELQRRKSTVDKKLEDLLQQKGHLLSAFEQIDKDIRSLKKKQESEKTKRCSIE